MNPTKQISVIYDPARKGFDIAVPASEPMNLFLPEGKEEPDWNRVAEGVTRCFKSALYAYADALSANDLARDMEGLWNDGGIPAEAATATGGKR